MTKMKTLHLFFKRQSVEKTLCGTTLGCRPLTGTTAHSPPLRADAVTGITRPRLLASSFSRRLQGDFHAPFLSALHQPAALFAETKGLLVLFYAKMFNSCIIISCFSRLSTGFPSDSCHSRCFSVSVFNKSVEILKISPFFLAHTFILWYTVCCENGWIMPPREIRRNVLWQTA